MTILDHPDAQALLADAVLFPEQVEHLALRLDPFLARYFPRFQRQEQRDNARLVLLGKLSSLSRKTAEPIAHYFQTRPESLQDFVGSSPWRDRPVLDEIRRHVQEAWADPDGVLIADGSAFAKKGDHSCGVQRQYCGRLGKVENCTVGLFVGYSCAKGHLLLEHRLFLPKEWAEDAERRQRAGVPEGVSYQEHWEIVLSLLDHCQDLKHGWVTCDSEFGRVNAFREGLRARGERYVVETRPSLRLRDLAEAPPPRQGVTGRNRVAPTRSAAEWASRQPPSAWRRVAVRAGEKEPLVVQVAQGWVQTFENTKLGSVERLVVIRTVDRQEARTWYCLSNAAASVGVEQLVLAHARRHWEEASFKEGKSEVGLGQYETRTWRGWHHHMTLSALALWFLAWQRSEEREKTPR